ncbi:MAG: FHA domain-containing protein, partial [Myxococcota bacterium]
MLEIWSQDQGIVATQTVDRTPFRLGRHGDADLHLANASVSKLHAALHREGDEFFLVDLGSRNGTYCNDARVGEEPVRLKDGDRLRLGRVELRFVIQTRRRPTSTVAEMPDQGGIAEELFGLGPLLQALRGEGLRPVFQSIHAVGSRAVVGHEALTWTKDVDGFPAHLMMLA